MAEADADLATQLASALGLPAGATPFPWQRRLLEEHFLIGDIPRSLDIPTGLGKTATIAIWLLARAAGAPIPRRLVYVVDRRAVVDQATEVATALRAWVKARPEVGERLGLGGRELPISTLRGRFVDNREWMEDPAQPAIIVGTVDMVGSRLLFEGYGSTRRIRPYQAGLLGNDTLFALDEAHLVPPFERLVEAAAARVGLGSSEADDQWPPPMRLLALSATGADHGGETFRLDMKDFEDAIVKKRLRAPKLLEIGEPRPAKELPDALAARAWELSGDGERPVRILIFTRKRDDAEKIYDWLEKKAGLRKRRKKDEPPPAELQLLVGARRVFERQEAARALQRVGFLAGSTVERRCPAFLCATSAGEVGVDLDADHMVCDLVAWERMVQRLGRVNRRGEGSARVVVVPETAGEKDPEALVARRSACRKILAALPGGERGRDGSPAALVDLTAAARTDPTLEALLREATTPAPLYPKLTRALLDAWSLTSLEKHAGRPEVGPWLRGWDDREPQTRVVWRAKLPPAAARSLADTKRFFKAAPPHTSELLETNTSRTVRWLKDRVKRRLKVLDKRGDAESQQTLEALVAVSQGDAHALEKTWSLKELHRLLTSKDLKRARDNFERGLRERTLVVHSSLGGLRAGMLDSKDDDVPRTADDDEEWLEEGKTARGSVVGFRIRESDQPETTTDRDWHERERAAIKWSESGEPTRWLVIDKWRHTGETEDDRSAGPAQTLADHQACAAQHAHSLGRRLALPAPEVEVIVTAARLHDEGKRATRWQRAFNAPRDDVYAKTRGPVHWRLLDRYRHELGSLAYARKDEGFQGLTVAQQELVLHLIAAHHGFARPLLRTDGYDGKPPSALRALAQEVALRFFRLQERWGPWGLAWWECLLRAADQQASRENDRRGRKPGTEGS